MWTHSKKATLWHLPTSVPRSKTSQIEIKGSKSRGYHCARAQGLEYLTSVALVVKLMVPLKE